MTNCYSYYGKRTFAPRVFVAVYCKFLDNINLKVEVPQKTPQL